MTVSRILRISWVGLVIAQVLTAVPAAAQNTQFGKNKVQYIDFQWSYIQSDHFDVYFAQGGQYLAEFAAAEAESAYASISRSFRYQIMNRVPFIVYNSHNEFQQTNVLAEYMEEGIGGVTELFKNRVVIPFEGDYRKFRHVIHHELVHAVINDMFYGGSIQSIISNNITLQLPLWFNEGLAEYEALRWDTDSDMFLRDATVHEYLPPIQQLNGYFAYRGGQSVFHYIARKYGEQKIGELLNRIKSTRSIEAGFRGSIGLSVEELSERWQRDQKVTYWPDIAKREDPGDYARRLTEHKKDGSFYNTSPAISPQGDRVAFISNKYDYFDVFVMSAVDGSNVQKLVDGQETNDFEELHLLTPGMSWSPDGKKLVVATKAGEQDALVIIDVATREQEKITLGMQGIFSVSWSPDGSRLAFIGNDSRQSDVCVLDLATRQVTNLTNDLFSDATPVWSPDGKTVYFSSDRGRTLLGSGITHHSFPYHQADLYAIDVETRAVTQLVDWPESDETSAVVSPDGKKLLFVSDRNGINNIYELDLATKASRPITNSLSGVYQLSLSRDGSKLAFASLNQSGFDIFLLRNPFDRTVKVAELEASDFVKSRHPATAPASPPVSVAIVPPSAAKDTAGLYGKDIQIDFSNYVFAGAKPETLPRDSTIARMPHISGNLDENGKYRVNRYKLSFTPDIIYGNAGYDTFYGVTGSTIMAFSDLMGDHQIVFSTNLLLDLKNSDYALQYYYLPNRIDWGFGGFHSARFIIIDDQFGGSLYRFRMYGGSVSAIYPFDRFRRLEFGLNWINLSKENLDQTNVPAQYRTVLLPQLSYTYDTSLWGFIAPITGSRYRVDLFGTPKLGKNGLSFANVTVDYRTYLRLGRYTSVAIRFAGGGSFGKNPQKFIIGGVDNWINRTFTNNQIPLENAEDYIFLQAGIPLRGFDYNAAIGTRYGLLNLEFRYPLLAFLQAGPLPIGLQTLGGVFFFDMGSAWDHERTWRGFQRDDKGNVESKDLLMGMGTGARIYFLAFLVRFDVAWAWNTSSFSPPKYYISLGLDF